MNQTQFSAILDVLATALGFTGPADAVLSRHFRDNRKLGSHDRHVIAETVFGILRHLPQIEWLVGGMPTPRQVLLAWFTGIERLNVRELSSVFSDDDRKYAGGLKAKSLKDAPLAVRASLPQWMVDALLEAGQTEEEVLALGIGLLQSAPLDLRVNALKAKNREEIIDRLSGAGIEAAPTPLSPFGLRVVGKPPINKTKVFEEGLVEVQDEGSQLLGLLTGAKRGQMVADFCAGAGGKTLLLGAMMQSTGRLYAFDVSEKRLANLKPRLARSGLSNVQPQLIASESDQKIKRLAGKMDVVLVDAPCSGLGTLRRNPDLKYRQTPESVAELNAKQASILASAARLTKSGGRLVYATCSLLRAENETIVEAFLAANPEFSLCDARELLPEGIAGQLDGPYLKLLPQKHGTDGFFAAALTRK
ncbi:16S rRNA (cytosine967-C5)-methyltransferase [Formivibrio citricus]|uniref:16S rRNA (Cytosine967-C5)-methyltransferase n=1 Tax=Formivibrio citricus TaxID=83765 RepID=A0A1I4WRH6_9NEIS|nr:RsmB/NOP family class I SAM-dependent RNA methyltransferase [Formivibrio citricus]SFN16398.1 16S rRNA (cytosine967-C5)-methyltransferase [Formivibrio citricus]